MSHIDELCVLAEYELREGRAALEEAQTALRLLTEKMGVIEVVEEEDLTDLLPSVIEPAPASSRRERRAGALVPRSGARGRWWVPRHVDPSAALARAIAANRKLSPVDMVVAYRADGTVFERKRPVPRRPFCSVTYAPVTQTCPDTCTFKNHGCMAQSGYTGRAVRRIEDEAKGLSVLDIALAEAREIDRVWPLGIPAWGGRDGNSAVDMRLHVSGDVTEPEPLAVLVAAIVRWLARGGGSPWTFTHAWMQLLRGDWGPISVLASVETMEQAAAARARGYTPALTLQTFPSEKVFRLEGSDTRWLPCPGETRGTTCVQCRACLDRTEWMFENNMGIAFAVHGPQTSDARNRLPVLRRSA